MPCNWWHDLVFTTFNPKQRQHHSNQQLDCAATHHHTPPSLRIARGFFVGDGAIALNPKLNI